VLSQDVQARVMAGAIPTGASQSRSGLMRHFDGLMHADVLSYLLASVVPIVLQT